MFAELDDLGRMGTQNPVFLSTEESETNQVTSSVDSRVTRREPRPLAINHQDQHPIYAALRM